MKKTSIRRMVILIAIVAIMATTAFAGSASSNFSVNISNNSVTQHNYGEKSDTGTATGDYASVIPSYGYFGGYSVSMRVWMCVGSGSFVTGEKRVSGLSSFRMYYNGTEMDAVMDLQVSKVAGMNYGTSVTFGGTWNP